MLYFEDFIPGDTRHFGACRMTREDIIAFATEFDPQPFHLDDEAAKTSMLGGLAASGWHTFAAMMRMNCDNWLLDSASMGGPEVEEARWLLPVRPGDVLSVRLTTNDRRVSQSRPSMGLITMTAEVLNQTGAVVGSTRHLQLMGLRNPASPPPATPRPQVEKPAPAAPLATFPAPESAASGWYEDMTPGAVANLGTHEFTRADVIRFATAYDPQPFHLDDAAAAASIFGRLAASGWHTVCAYMRRLVLTRQEQQARLIARGTTPPMSGPSPGFRNLRWLRPVFPGDRVTYSAWPIERRVTSRKGWGLVTVQAQGINQDGVKVFEYTGMVFSPMRESAG